MSNESDSSTPAPPTAHPGPDLLAERTLSGIFVHLLGAGTWFVGPAVVYLASSHEFSRTNARNALNWQLLHAAVLATLFGAVGVVFLADSALPGGLPRLLGLGMGLALFAGFTVHGVVFLLNLVFVLVATMKAVFGTAWTYPIAPDTVGRLATATSGSPPWWVALAAYTAVAPALFALVGWAALGNDVPFWGLFVSLVVTVVAAPIVAAALYRDQRALRDTGTAWQPSWPAYLGLPAGTAVTAYLASDALRPPGNPAGDAVYAFMAALWLASLVYLAMRHHHVGTR